MKCFTYNNFTIQKTLRNIIINMESSTLTRGMGIKANAETDIIRNKCRYLREIVLTLGVM